MWPLIGLSVLLLLQVLLSSPHFMRVFGVLNKLTGKIGWKNHSYVLVFYTTKAFEVVVFSTILSMAGQWLLMLPLIAFSLASAWFYYKASLESGLHAEEIAAFTYASWLFPGSMLSKGVPYATVKTGTLVFCHLPIGITMEFIGWLILVPVTNSPWLVALVIALIAGNILTGARLFERRLPDGVYKAVYIGTKLGEYVAFLIWSYAWYAVFFPMSLLAAVGIALYALSWLRTEHHADISWTFHILLRSRKPNYAYEVPKWIAPFQYTATLLFCKVPAYVLCMVLASFLTH